MLTSIFCKLFGNRLDWQGIFSTRTFTKNNIDYRDFLDEKELRLDTPKSALEFVKEQMTYKEDVGEQWTGANKALFRHYGDCEEFAFTLCSLLINMVLDARVCIGYLRNQGHAWVLLYRGNKPYLLDATTKEPVWRAELTQNYKPIISFDRQMFYTHAKEETIQNFLLGRIVLPTGRSWFENRKG